MLTIDICEEIMIDSPLVDYKYMVDIVMLLNIADNRPTP